MQLSDGDNDVIVGIVGLGGRYLQIMNGRPLSKKIKMGLDALKENGIFELDVIKDSMDDFNQLINNMFEIETIDLIKSNISH